MLIDKNDYRPLVHLRYCCIVAWGASSLASGVRDVEVSAEMGRCVEDD